MISGRGGVESFIFSQGTLCEHAKHGVGFITYLKLRALTCYYFLNNRHDKTTFDTITEHEPSLSCKLIDETLTIFNYISADPIKHDKLMDRVSLYSLIR